MALSIAALLFINLTTLNAQTIEVELLVGSANLADEVLIYTIEPADLTSALPAPSTNGLFSDLPGSAVAPQFISAPQGMAFQPGTGDLLVGAFFNDAILRIDGDTGAYLGVFITDPLLSRPRDITVVGNILYVASSGNGRILRFNATTGALIDTFALFGAVWGLAYGADGLLYASSFGGNNITRFDATGAVVGGGAFVAGIAQPGDLNFGPDGLLYVSLYGAIRAYDTTGALVRTIAPGFPNQFQRANAVIFGPDDYLYVTNIEGGRIHRIDPATGAFVDMYIPTITEPVWLIFRTTITDAVTVADEVVADAPPMPNCTTLSGESASIVRIGGGANVSTYCNILNENGVYRALPASLGSQSIIERQVLQAVDVFDPLPFNGAVSVCLQGSGEIIYLNANDAPRVPITLPSSQQGSFTCAAIPNPGTVVLVVGSGATMPVSPAGDTTTIALSNCQVTTNNMLNLRAEPSTSAAILDVVPYDLTLTALQRSGDWLRVIYLDGQGWLNANYLRLEGVCGA